MTHLFVLSADLLAYKLRDPPQYLVALRGTEQPRRYRIPRAGETRIGAKIRIGRSG